jgi:hypothetical protein
MKLEIVSHCWNYGRLLTYQLSSLVSFPPSLVTVCMTVFCSDEDPQTLEVVDFFQRIEVPALRIRLWKLPTARLFVRGIGRNLAALATDADWIWFTDCDYCFRGGTIDWLAHASIPDNKSLIFPRRLFQSRSHTDGDRAIEEASGEPRIVNIRESDFIAVRLSRAIGGVQICRGDVARDRGYVRGAKFHHRKAARWQRAREDVAFRRDLRTRGMPVEMPNVFRIRHSQCGRQTIGIRL